jgi:hypothetical protein
MFRFTIRDVLWLTVVVAVGCGWWLEHRAFRAYRQKQMINFNFKFKSAPVTGGVTRVSGTQDSSQDADEN